MTNYKQLEIEFTKNGTVYNDAQVTSLLAVLPDATDVFVASHGWNNDVAEARDLYDKLFTSVSNVVGTKIIKRMADRKFIVARIFWPSKKFDDEDLIPGGGAASASVENTATLLKLLERLKDDPTRLGTSEKNWIRTQTLSRAQELVPNLQNNELDRREYVLLLRSILDTSQAEPDDGSSEFFGEDPEALFKSLTGDVQAPHGPDLGGATSVHRSGAAASVNDLFGGILGAARRIANYATYFEMKQRAGIVGASGLAPLIQRIRGANPSIKVHLVGHSFGGRLVTAAASRLSLREKVTTVTLLQAAFSHNGIAAKFDGQHDGAFRNVIAAVSGPILITHTKNDAAVGIAYPLASRFSRDQASAIGDENDPYGGMGRNGAQHTPEAIFGRLEDVGGRYQFVKGNVYNLKADNFISSHGDVTGHQVAYAILNAVNAVD
jgi:hypothetical protein